jgi:hypothetical protein
MLVTSRGRRFGAVHSCKLLGCQNASSERNQEQQRNCSGEKSHY